MKASPLAESIDPKAFFMMLSANFPVIYRGGKLHLAPIWDLLAQKHPPETLIGMFLRFEQAGLELQIPSVLPDTVRALDAEMRQAHLMHFLGNDEPASMHDPSGLTPLLAIDAINENVEPIPLSTGDLKPMINDELRRKVSQAIVTAIRASSIGQRVQPAQVAYMIDTNFENLCDGARFDFRPVDSALREVGEVSDADIYGIVLRLQDALERMEIEVVTGKLNLDNETKAAIEDRVRRPSRISDPRIPAMNTPRPESLPKREKGETPSGEIVALPPQDNTKEAKLRRLGLGKSSKYWQRVRVGVLGVSLAVVAVVAFLNRPTRSLDLDTYDAAMPMKSANLVDGTFQAVLDEARWDKLSRPEQEKSIAALNEILKEEGIVADTQIRDARSSVVIVSRGNTLIASEVIMGRLQKNKPSPKEQAENR